MTSLDPVELDAAILAAHEAGDTYRLAELYERAAEQKSSEQDADAAAFLLTQAYVFALDSGHPSALVLRRALIAQGREQVE